MAKLREVEKCFLLCKICVLGQQKPKPSYKIQSQLEEIYKIQHVEIIRPITSTGFKGCRYALHVIDRYSKYQCVKIVQEKSEAGLALKRFVIFIENQTGKIVKRIHFD